jgi:hypothetical protein
MAGLSCKLYDDLVDNPFLKNHSTPFVLEFLKGIHTVLFTVVSLHEPLFYLCICFINIFHFFSSPASFELPYEKSCLYFFIVLFFFIKKINFHVNKMEYVLIPSIFIFGFIEPLFFKKEYSIVKFIFRGISSAACFVLSFISTSFMRYIFLYFSGYTLCSAYVQFYSIFKNVILSKKFKKIKKICNQQLEPYYKIWKELVKDI